VEEDEGEVNHVKSCAGHHPYIHCPTPSQISADLPDVEQNVSEVVEDHIRANEMRRLDDDRREEHGYDYGVVAGKHERLVW
jgi:hypothetical protein